MGNQTKSPAGVHDRLRDTLHDMRVGTRLLITGPALDVHTARAVAAEHGVMDEEMTLLPTDDGARRVFCAHCHSVTVTEDMTGTDDVAAVDCGSCKTALVVSSHFSRRMAAYLGYSAHAEEPDCRSGAREAA